MAYVGQKAETIENEGVEEALHCERDSLNKLLINYLLQVPVEDVGSISNVLAIDNE